MAGRDRTAEGVSAGHRAQARSRDLPVVDATCPLVAAGHAELARFVADGDTVVIIGRRGHSALPPLVDQQPGRVVVIERPQEVARLRIDPEHVSYTVQTGMMIDDATPVIAALRARFPRIRGLRPEFFCYAVSDRSSPCARWRRAVTP